jgi:NADH dehydrogenase/NADH:ubiquinone oxidoreductase subunit G
MTDTISLTIDGEQVTVEPGLTLLAAAREAGKEIPTICYHEATTSNALCRLCVVEVEGQRLLQPACIVKAVSGMQVRTRSPRVDRARKTILEMLASTMDLSDAPAILTLFDEYGAVQDRFPEAEPRVVPLKDDNPMYVRDYSKCLLCWRCVQVCAEDAQYTFALGFDGRGYETQIATFFEKPIPETTCVLCGQCVGVCPTGALKPKREFLLEQGLSPQEITVLNSGRKKRRNRPQADTGTPTEAA